MARKKSSKKVKSGWTAREVAATAIDGADFVWAGGWMRRAARVGGASTEKAADNLLALNPITNSANRFAGGARTWSRIKSPLEHLADTVRGK